MNVIRDLRHLKMALDLSQWVTVNLISTPFVAMHDAIIIHLISRKIPSETNNVKLPLSS